MSIFFCCNKLYKILLTIYWNILRINFFLILCRTETENTNSTSQNKSEVHASIDAYLATAEGVDPEDPEEIARKKFYKANLDVFDQIVAINKSKKRFLAETFLLLT